MSTAQEIINRIKERQARENGVTKSASGTNYTSGTNYFETRRDCFKKVNRDIKSFKALAPSAPAHGECDNAQVHQTVNGTRAIAAPSACDSRLAHGSPDINAPASPAARDDALATGSLEINDLAAFHTHDEEDKPDKTECGDTGEPVEVDEDAIAKAAAFNPNFYYLRHDLFDNGNAKRISRYKSKITARVTPESDESIVMVVEFHNRSRDFKIFPKQNGLWEHEWYQKLWSSVKTAQKEPLDWLIEPTIGIIKERQLDGRKFVYKPVAFAACILWQERGDDPVIFTYYGSWRNDMTMGNDFETRKESNLFRVGRYRDERRQARKPKSNLIFKAGPSAF